MTPVERAARAMADDWNPHRDPVLSAMFRDYAQSAFESIDTGELARAITASLRGRRWADLTPLDIANTVRDYLLTGDESDE